MELLDKVLELDRAYISTFTNRLDKSWGTIFFNERQPHYYDANHAQISEAVDEPARVVQEVSDFYKEKNIIPRFYIYNHEDNECLLKELHEAGFRTEELGGPVQLWDHNLKATPLGEDFSIEEVTDRNLREAIDIEITIKEFGGLIREEALKEEIKHPGFTHFLLRYNGVACSTACIFHDSDQARLESVATLEEYRGKGLIGKLIRYIQQEVHDRGFTHLWVFPISDQVEKVYSRYGFETLDNINTIHAFAGGKSVMEIREGK
jgi:N-acetylglutamate synthase-like GNAT family acetyltransferase